MRIGGAPAVIPDTPPPGDAVIEAVGLTRVFSTTVREPGAAGFVRALVAPRRERTTAVDDVSFTVGRSELVALLGPNGAGKSTTIKMLTGILMPTEGRARVAGLDPHRDRERNAYNIGAVFGQRTQLWWDLPARESLAILRDIYGVPRSEHAARLAEFDRLLDLSAFWNTRVRHLSLGQRVRCDLAAALLHDPSVVFLDEPTIGMDAVVKEQVREFLRHEVTTRGRTVLLTTHDMVEVERLAHRVVLINHGRIELDGTLDEMRRMFGGAWRLTVTIDGTNAARPEPPPGLVELERQGDVTVFGPDGTAGVPVADALRWVLASFRVLDVSIAERPLEDVMRAAFSRVDGATNPEQREDGGR